MSRMLAALRHLERQAGGSRDPSSKASPANTAAPATAEPRPPVIDVPASVAANVEFIENAALVLTEVGLPGFVANFDDDRLAAVPDLSLLAGGAKNVAAKSAAPAFFALAELPATSDPYNPAASAKSAGPYRADWSYGRNIAPVLPRSKPADRPAIELPIGDADDEAAVVVEAVTVNAPSRRTTSPRTMRWAVSGSKSWPPVRLKLESPIVAVGPVVQPETVDEHLAFASPAIELPLEASRPLGSIDASPTPDPIERRKQPVVVPTHETPKEVPAPARVATRPLSPAGLALLQASDDEPIVTSIVNLKEGRRAANQPNANARVRIG